MSKEEFLKIQTCVLKVNIHCDGCKQKVKKILQKIEGVYTTKIDSEQGKVTVSGNVDPAKLINKLNKKGKHAELWGAPKGNNHNHNQLNNQFKNLQIDNGKGGGGGGGNKGQGQKGGGNNQPKGGGPQGQNPQQLQQMKGFQDLKLPPQFMKDPRMMPLANNKDPKAAKFNMPQDDGLSDDELDEFDDEYDFDDDDLDDDMDYAPLNKMKPVMGPGHGGSQMPNMMNGQHPQLGKGGGNGGNNGGGNGKKGGGGGGGGGGGNIPVQINHGGGNDGKGGANGGKKGGGNGNNNGGNQNQGGGKGGKNGGGQNGGAQNKNGNNGNNFSPNGARNGGPVNDGPPRVMPNMMAVGSGGGMSRMGNMPMGHMSNPPVGQMSNLAAVQGLPASAVSGGTGGGPGYFQGAGPGQMPGNPYYQQQMAAMMMNQQHANGNERFQPMMYARPPPAVNYMAPYPPYPYPPPGERIDQYAMFSDENTSSCAVM